MATTVCLSNNVPIETVSSILGHKNIRTTQIYAKITKEKVKKDMTALAAQLNCHRGICGSSHLIYTVSTIQIRKI